MPLRTTERSPAGSSAIEQNCKCCNNLACAHLLLEICSQLRSASSPSAWSFCSLAAIRASRCPSNSVSSMAPNLAAKPSRKASMRFCRCAGPCAPARRQLLTSWMQHKQCKSKKTAKPAASAQYEPGQIVTSQHVAATRDQPYARRRPEAVIQACPCSVPCRTDHGRRSKVPVSALT